LEEELAGTKAALKKSEEEFAQLLRVRDVPEEELLFN
jgi:hypothetical protein